MQIGAQRNGASSSIVGGLYFSPQIDLTSKDSEFFTNSACAHNDTALFFCLAFFFPFLSPEFSSEPPMCPACWMETVSPPPQRERRILGWKITETVLKAPEVLKPAPPNILRPGGRSISNANHASFFENSATVNSKATAQLALFPTGKFSLW